MKYHNMDEMRISSFSLGTVQLGLKYGLGTDNEKPSLENAFALLDKAAELGVNTWDTANNYGDSETVIGKWLRERPNTPRPNIITKIGPCNRESPEAMYRDIMEQTQGCLKTLGLEQLDMLMVHNVEDYETYPDLVEKTFQKLKDEGLIRHTGISLYSHHDYHHFAKTSFEAVQIPLNVFDWSRIDDGSVAALADAGKTIFVRSVYLQGLVFLKPEQVEDRMIFCTPYLQKYLDLCQELQMEPAQLAISFAISVPGISSLVLGCQNDRLVQSNWELMEKAAQLTPEQMAKLHDAFAEIDPRVVDPKRWHAH